MIDTKDTKTKEEAKTIKDSSPKTSQGGFEISDTAASKTTRKFINKKFDKKRSRKDFNKPRSEYDQKIISMRRVTRVVAGGRRFRFSVGIVIGNRNGSVGVGIGKAGDTALAIEKALRDAKKNLIMPLLTKTKSIPYDVDAKYTASRVMMVPTPGKGLKAGGAMRTILDLLGAKDVTGKILSRSKNHVNNAKATVEALKKIGLKKPTIKPVVSETAKDNKKDITVKIVKKEKTTSK